MSKESITVNGVAGYLYHDGIYGTLATNIDEYALYVTGKASKNELIKIALLKGEQKIIENSVPKTILQTLLICN